MFCLYFTDVRLLYVIKVKILNKKNKDYYNTAMWSSEKKQKLVYRNHDKQRLHRENCVAPVVARNWSVVFLNRYNPSAKSLHHKQTDLQVDNKKLSCQKETARGSMLFRNVMHKIPLILN